MTLKTWRVAHEAYMREVWGGEYLYGEFVVWFELSHKHGKAEFQLDADNLRPVIPGGLF